MSARARISKPPQTRMLSLVMVAVLGLVGGAQARPRTAQTSETAASAVRMRGPIGWQSYRRLDLLPYIRQGVATYQTSSADPTGHNDDGYSGRYSCLHRVRLGCVMAEHTGPGELESVWTAGNQEANPFPSGHLIIQLDGRTVVDAIWPQLTSGRPPGPFAFPLALAPNESWGGSSLQVPMTFRRGMRVISQFNPHYFHVVFRTFTTAEGLDSAGPATKNPADILSELRQAGTRDPKPRMGSTTSLARGFAVRPGRAVTLATIHGSGTITALRLRVSRYGLSDSIDPVSAAGDFYRGARLRISFDGARTVDAPLGEFFGSGLGPAPVRSLLFAMSGTPDGWASSWWPMPFASTARIELYNGSRTIVSAGRLRLQWARDRRWTKRLAPGGGYAYFHAQGRRGRPRYGRYWTFLDTRGSGTFMGVTLTIEGGSPPFYMEGNERGYVDGTARPQLQGTGTEDFFDGGWYFFDNLFTLPLSGYTAHETASDGCPTPTCKTAYRLMVADAVPFHRSILYEIEHGSGNTAAAIYSSTAYWYESAR
jgi:Protein of unknown function (DUF2961)